MRFPEKGDEKEKKEKEITLREIVDGNEVERKMDKEEEVEPIIPPPLPRYPSSSQPRSHQQSLDE